MPAAYTVLYNYSASRHDGFLGACLLIKSQQIYRMFSCNHAKLPHISAFSKDTEPTAKVSHLCMLSEPDIFVCLLIDIDFADAGDANACGFGSSSISCDILRRLCCGRRTPSVISSAPLGEL